MNESVKLVRRKIAWPPVVSISEPKRLDLVRFLIAREPSAVCSYRGCYRIDATAACRALSMGRRRSVDRKLAAGVVVLVTLDAS